MSALNEQKSLQGPCEKDGQQSMTDEDSERPEEEIAELIQINGLKDAGLSERQAQVYQLQRSGYSNGEIANQLDIDVANVRHYQQKAQQKIEDAEQLLRATGNIRICYCCGREKLNQNLVEATGEKTARYCDTCLETGRIERDEGFSPAGVVGHNESPPDSIDSNALALEVLDLEEEVCERYRHLDQLFAGGGLQEISDRQLWRMKVRFEELFSLHPQAPTSDE